MARVGASARASRDERRVEVERRLVTTLERLIVEQPRFTDITLSQLLDETGLSRTSFYKYFQSKADVLVAWFDETVERLLAAPRPQAGASPTRDELRIAMEGLAAVYRPELPLIAAVYETAAHDADMRARLAEALAQIEDRVRRHIVRGRREGWINPVLEPAAMARWIVALCEDGLRYIVGPAQASELPAVIGAWADTLWFTLYEPVQRLPT
jgi:AcrR family transcriptional regulator